MKVVFINGSLEPGKDGVGDYTRRLAGELIRQGHDCRIVALMDKFLTESVKEVQVSESVEILTLRLPFDKGYEYNSKDAKNWIDDFDPEWISIQYVPFSFHEKGLPFNFGKSIQTISKGRKLHFMFHELWVGIEITSTVKYILWGYLQKLLLKYNLLFILPDEIHTQSDLYVLMLDNLKIKARRLPVFSNFTCLEPGSYIRKSFNRSPNSTIDFLLFGTIHKEDSVYKFLEYLYYYQIKFGKVIIHSIGRAGAEINTWVSICSNLGLELKVHGEQSPRVISKFLSSGMIGLSTTALPMIQKSGTVSSMREFGMPVICIASDWLPRNVTYNIIPYGIFPFNSHAISLCLSFDGKDKDFPGLESVAKRFVYDLIGN